MDEYPQPPHRRYITRRVILVAYLLVVLGVVAYALYLRFESDKRWAMEEARWDSIEQAIVTNDPRYATDCPPMAPLRETASPSPQDTDAEVPYDVVEEMPEFVGGEAALYQYLQDHLRYPQRAKDEGLQGRVMVRLIIERDGSVSSAEAARGISPDLDREALRLISTLPKWKPGRQLGKPVRTRLILPIVFELR